MTDIFALIIGINYKSGNTRVSPLDGCVNDANAFQSALPKGSVKYCKKLLEKDASKENIEKEMREIVSLVNNEKTPVLVIYYAGHGTRQRDTEGDEKDLMDECIVCYDGRVIKDDWIFENVVVSLNANVRACFVTDCCHSGTMYDLPMEFIYDRKEKTMVAGFPVLHRIPIQAQCLSLSGCLDSQYAGETYFERSIRGIFTSALIKILPSLLENPPTSIETLGEKIQASMETFRYPGDTRPQLVSISTNFFGSSKSRTVTPTTTTAETSTVEPREAIADTILQGLSRQVKPAKSFNVTFPTFAFLILGALFLRKNGWF